MRFASVPRSMLSANRPTASVTARSCSCTCIVLTSAPPVACSIPPERKILHDVKRICQVLMPSRRMKYNLAMATLSRRERTDATRQATETALMRATIELLGEGQPFAELGIEQIVRRAGFSRPTFYSYFRDKRELILRLGEQLQESAA